MEGKICPTCKNLFFSYNNKYCSKKCAFSNPNFGFSHNKGLGWSTRIKIGGKSAAICKSCRVSTNSKPLINCQSNGHLLSYRRCLQNNENKAITVIMHYGGRCVCCGFND